MSGVIAAAFGWRWVFFGILPVAVLAAILVVPAIRNLPRGDNGRPDWDRMRRAVLLSVGMAVLLAGLGQPHLLLAFLLTSIGMAFLFVAFRVLLPAGTLRAERGAPAAVLAMLLLSVGFYGVEAFIPLLLTEVRGESIAFGGLPLTASAMSWTAGSWLLERRAASADRGALARVGFILIALGIVGVGAELLPAVPVVLAPISWAVAGLGVGLAYATAQLVTLETAPPEGMGRATSTLQLTHTAAIALATGVGGALIARFGTSIETLPYALGLQGALMLGIVALGITIAGRLSSPTTSTALKSAASS